MRRVTWIVAALAVLSAAPAGAARPCTCKDIDAIKKAAFEAARGSKAWAEVVAAMEDGAAWPADMNEARARFRQNMGYTSTRKVGGVDPATGEPVLDPEFERENCEIIVQGVREHERAHTRYFWSNPFAIVTLDDRKLALVLARSEVVAHDAQHAYLSRELERLEESCRWKCKCTQEWFGTATECAGACPKPSMACIAPTCCQWNRKTGERERCL